MILRNINPCVLAFLGSLFFYSCNKGMNLRCENSYLNSVGENVENCECRPGYRPSGGRLPFDRLPRSWDGMGCSKLMHVSSNRYLPVFTKESIGNKWIEKGLVAYYDDFFAFRADSPEEWTMFYGRQGTAEINVVEYPSYQTKVFMNFRARSLRQRRPDSRDSIEIDLRILPGGYGYTDHGEGIIVAFRIDRYSHPGEIHFLNPMIHLTAPGDDSSFIPIRSYPIEELE